MMIRSAPSRFAAITPQRPTAAVADDRSRLAGPDLGGDGGMVAGAHHVGEGEKRRHQRVVLGDRERDERAVGEWNPNGLGLGSRDIRRAEEAAVDA